MAEAVGAAAQRSPPYEGGVPTLRRRGGSLDYGPEMNRVFETSSQREPPRQPKRLPPLLRKEGSFGAPDSIPDS
jgi:hypothetical protein